MDPRNPAHVLTVDGFYRLFTKTPQDTHPSLVAAAWEFDIRSPVRLAAWIAQLAHKSAGFTRFSENLHYSAQRMTEVWPSRFPTLASADPYASNPAALANKVYGGRLGNGPESSGDGWRYRGRGPIQVTGKDNYMLIGDALGLDLITDPDLLLYSLHGCRAAGHFWASNGCNQLADANTGPAFLAITKRISGAHTGHTDRSRWWARTKQAFGA